MSYVFACAVFVVCLAIILTSANIAGEDGPIPVFAGLFVATFAAWGAHDIYVAVVK